jgi:hypothetical protein
MGVDHYGWNLCWNITHDLHGKVNQNLGPQGGDATRQRPVFGSGLL